MRIRCVTSYFKGIEGTRQYNANQSNVSRCLHGTLWVTRVSNWMKKWYKQTDNKRSTKLNKLAAKNMNVTERKWGRREREWRSRCVWENMSGEDIEEKWVWENRSESAKKKQTTPNDVPCKRIISVPRMRMRMRCRRTQKLMWMFCMQICVRLLFFLLVLHVVFLST